MVIGNTLSMTRDLDESRGITKPIDNSMTSMILAKDLLELETLSKANMDSTQDLKFKTYSRLTDELGRMMQMSKMEVANQMRLSYSMINA